MACSCIEGKSGFNFSLESISADSIVVQDLSHWMEGGDHVIPSEYDVKITPPATGKSVSKTLSTNSPNILSKDDLGSMRSGVYTFETSPCGISYIRKAAVFPDIECCLKSAWAVVEEEREMEKLETIERHLKMAKINAEFDNFNEAANHIEIARKLMDNVKCDCDCR